MNVNGQKEKRRQYADEILDILGIGCYTQFIVVFLSLFSFLSIQPKVCQSIQTVEWQHKKLSERKFTIINAMVHDFKRIWNCLEQMKWFITVICVDASAHDGKANGIHLLECILHWVRL